MTVQQILRVIAIGSRKQVSFGYKNTRGVRQVVVGRIVGMHMTTRGLTFKLDTGKTCMIRCNRETIAQLYA